MSDMINLPNPKEKFGAMKRRVDLVPPALMLGAAKAFAEGAEKYNPYNWRTSKVETMTYIGAIIRHAFAYMDGEDVDPESKYGKLHLEGIAACAGILLDGTYGDFLIDNRPVAGPAPKLTRLPGFVEKIVAEVYGEGAVEKLNSMAIQSPEPDYPDECPVFRVEGDVKGWEGAIVVGVGFYSCGLDTIVLAGGDPDVSATGFAGFAGCWLRPLTPAAQEMLDFNEDWDCSSDG